MCIRDSSTPSSAGGAPADEGVESIETAAVRLAWSVMSTFVVMLYAASLTAKLVGRRERFVGITTMEQCEKSRCTVCVPSVMEPTMRRLHENRINYHVSTSSTNVFRDLEDGACDLGLMIERRFNTMWSSGEFPACLLYTSPSPRDGLLSRMPSSA